MEKQVKELIPIDDLVEEVIASVGQLISARQDYQEGCLTIFHMLGMNIVGHPAYKKGRHSQGEFFENLANATNEKQGRHLVSADYLQKAAYLYSEYPELRTAVLKLTELGKSATIGNARLLLRGVLENKIENPPKGSYEVIVIDPPWPYGTEFNSESRRVASPYRELNLDELKNLKIPSAPNSVLWLWTTHKFLSPAFDLLKEWGFEYKLTMVWDKEKMGMGAWLRCQVEFCLLGIRGNPKWELTNQRDIIREARREHSRKPDAFYRMVEKLTPSEHKIDIFGRRKRHGWVIYGNESGRF